MICGKRARKRRAVIQAVGRCCLDGYDVQGDVWRNPDSTKATASGTCMHPTNQPLHQGAGEAGKARSESSTPSEATSHLGSQGRGFDSRRRRPPFVVNPALILYPAWYGAYSVTCLKPIIVTCGSLCNSWWNVYRNHFTSEILPGGKKDELY